ncbi:tail sheath protein [Shewanella sp. phage 1/4]|uniref:tail sheath n=1 Tax=Shewanella phage 1/4 TaxID=1458859 RepID=UPI0004F810A8|nr:tail sheath [Shewanella sp. phage 1/4]AHK11260.1 tail sheath protein [Shewanella sp. phage 1/4]
MPYQPSVSSTITRNTTSAEGISLSFPIFCAPHTYFKERTRSYGSFDEVRSDSSIPSTSSTYKALLTAFSQSPAPSRVYVGRQQADTTTTTITIPTANRSYGYTIAAYDSTTGEEQAQAVISFTSVDAVAANISTGLIAETELSAVDAYLTAVLATAKIVITPVAGTTLVITGYVGLTATHTSTETAPDLLAAIQDADNDWYCMTAENHTETFQLAMAASIEATGGGDFPKIYWTSTSNVNTIAPVVDPATDVIGKLKALGYDRTICDWSHVADSVYPEIGTFSGNSAYQAGSTTYKFLQVKGIPAAANVVTGNKLPTYIQGYINDRNGGWMGEERGVTFYHEGKTVGGEWIDIILGADWLNDQMEVALLNLQLNNKGSKISYAKPEAVISVINSVLDLGVRVGFLDGYVGATIPDYLTEIPFADKASRILRDVKWTGYIDGAVHSILVNGNLTYQSAELS